MATIDHTKPKDLPKFDHRILDLAGRKFTRLTVVKFAGRTSKNLIVWECLCDCGKTCFRTSHQLRDKIERSRRRSCGCLASDVTRERSITHGRHGSPEYQSWRSMIERCENPNATGYENYGGRGISICDRWRESFAAFYEDMGDRPHVEHQIDRINNDGNYEPSNCQWATIKQQANNRRKAKPRLLITFKGESLSIEQWARRLDVSVNTIYMRRWKGMPIEKVLSTNLRR